ncbi:molecular chaperone [Kluyvera sichuanensis]|uniref:fimbrial biogenesis chaperone n=1 Tax=Kluyvera sichuanensis TaxID=2725494 RepID=UPI002FD0DE3C
MFNLKHAVFIAVAAAASLYQVSAGASITLAGTRFVYSASEDSLPVTVYNRDKAPYLVQSWVSEYNPDKDHPTHIPFIVTPPLFKMEPGDTDTINIVKMDSDNLPQDRESVFYFNVKAIPGKAKDGKSSLMISVDSSMKLFYRPQKLEGDNADSAWKNLEFQRKDNQLVAKNPTPYFITIHTLNSDGKVNPSIKNVMIAPFGQMTLPISIKPNSITWTALSDQGVVTTEKTVPL